MPVPKATTPQTKVRPRVLVVDDEPGLIEVVTDVVRSMDCRITTATTIAEAKKVLASQDVEVLVTDVHLPDGDGTSLLSLLHRRHPTASAIVITGSPSIDTAVSALRQGAIDFLPKPFDAEQLAGRVRKAIQLQAEAARDERKIERLRIMVRRLNEARKLISKKVDILCNDLITAYGELSKQVEGVRSQEGFRKVIDQADDLEHLLCHAMDWLLRQVGYSNVAVWLAGEDGEYQLGAYMKFTIAGDKPLTEAIKRVVLPLAGRDGTDAVIRTKAADLGDKFTPAEAALLKGQDVLALNCTYLGESLAALVFFRDEKAPFTADDETLLKAIGPIFAVALANVVRGDDSDDGDDDHDRDEAAPDEVGPSDTSVEDEPERGGKGGKGKSKRKANPRDAADWWKRGEPPPF